MNRIRCKEQKTEHKNTFKRTITISLKIFQERFLLPSFNCPNERLVRYDFQKKHKQKMNRIGCKEQKTGHKNTFKRTITTSLKIFQERFFLPSFNCPNERLVRYDFQKKKTKNEQNQMQRTKNRTQKYIQTNNND